MTSITNRIIAFGLGLCACLAASAFSAPYDESAGAETWRKRYAGEFSVFRDPALGYAAFRKGIPEAVRAGREGIRFEMFARYLDSFRRERSRDVDAAVRAYVKDARAEMDESLRVRYSYHFNAVRGVEAGGTTLEHFKIRPGEELEVFWTDPEYRKPPPSGMRVELALMKSDSAGRPAGFRAFAEGRLEKDGLFHRYSRRLGEAGAYRVTIADRDFFQQSYVQVGWLDLALKDDGKSLLAFVSSPRDTLNPPYRIRMTGVGGIDRMVDTDSNGIAMLEFPADAAMRRSLRLRAWKPGGAGDAAYMGGPETSPAQGWWECRVYTDRPRYRPGDRVHFRGLVKRAFPDGTLQDGWTGRVELTIRDARNAELFRRSVSVDAWGGFGDSLLLPDEPALGVWRLNAQAEAGVYRTAAFKVEEYRKPDFEIKLKTEWHSRTGLVRLRVDGAYYAGGALARTPVEVRWRWDGEWGWGRRYPGWSSGPRRFSRASGDCIRIDTLMLDKRGSATVEFRPPQNAGWRVLAAEAIVRDLSGREVREYGRAAMVDDTGSLSLDLDRFRYEPGESAHGRLLLLGPDGSPAGGPVRLIASRDGAAWRDTMLALAPDGTVEFRFDALTTGQYRIQAVARAEGKGKTIDLKAETAFLVVRIIRSGAAPALALRADKLRYRPGDTARIAIRGGGKGTRILLTLEGEGLAASRIARGEESGEAVALVPLPKHLKHGVIAVLADGRDGWDRETLPLELKAAPARVRAVFEGKRDWKPGEEFRGRIRVLDSAGKPLPARVSIGVVDEALFADEDEPETSLLGMLPKSAGNRVWSGFGENASDFLWAWAGKRRYPPLPKGGDGYDAYAAWPGYGSGWYGQKARGKRRGAVLQLGPAGPRFGSMANDLSYAELAYGSISMLLRQASAPSPRERSVFRDEAYWLASGATGARGEIDFGFRLPDDLTRWRITVKGAGAGSAVIDFRDSLTAHLDLSARLRAPRSLTVGDSLEAAAVLRNATRKPRGGRVGLEADDSSRASIGPAGSAPDSGQGSGRATREIILPKGITRSVWALRPLRPGPVRLRAVFDAGEGEGDAEARVVPVHAPGLPRILAAGGVLASGTSGGGTVGNMNDTRSAADTVAWDLSGGYYPATAELRVEASTHAILLLRSSLRSLLEYPYGCAEQTLNRFVPLVQVAAAMRRAGIRDAGLEDQVRLYAEAGLERLESMQQPEGGWGWWQGAGGEAGITVQVVEGMALARKAALPESLAQRAQALQASGLRALVRHRGPMFSDPKSDPRALVFLLHALYLGVEPAELKPDLERLFALRNTLTSPSLARLLECLHIAGRTAGEKEILRMLEARAIRGGGKAWWRVDSAASPDAIRETEGNAFILAGLAASAPGHPLLVPAEKWLYGRKRRDGWGHTRATAAVISALSAVASTQTRAQPGAALTVAWNGKSLFHQPLAEGARTFHDSLRLEPGALDSLMRPGSNRLTVAYSGNGSLFYAAELRYADGSAEARAQSGGFHVSRWYRKAFYRHAPGEWLRRTALLGRNAARVGEEIQVSVLVTSDTVRSHVLVEDFFPAGMEYLDRGPGWMTKYASEWYQGWGHKEARDDRVAFFISVLPKGKTLFTYLLRAETPGVFIARPARAELMYEPEISANARQDTLRISR